LQLGNPNYILNTANEESLSYCNRFLLYVIVCIFTAL
jgi:hypothetical protein